jgi:hypothetical protein
MTINDIRNEGFTVWNTVSLVTDVASVILPVVPAGVSHAVRAMKYANKAINAVDTVIDAAKVANKLDNIVDAGKAAGKMDSLSDLGKAAGDVCNINSFSAETQVATPEGSEDISAIQIGDYVLAWNEADGTLGYYEVTDTISHIDQVVVEVIIGGEWIETTPEHPFYVEGKGWVEAKDLRTGMRVRQADGTTGMVWLKWTVYRVQPMYNLTVDEAHTFYVGEGQWLVHNACSGTILSRNLGGEAGDGMQAHHLIPCEFECHPFVRRATAAGWDMNEAYNGILLPDNPNLSNTLRLPRHAGYHSEYSLSVRNSLNYLEDIASSNGWSNAQSFTQLKSFATSLRNGIIGMGGGVRLR